MKNILDVCLERMDFIHGYILNFDERTEKEFVENIQKFKESFHDWSLMRRYAEGMTPDKKLKQVYVNTILGMYEYNRSILTNSENVFPTIYHDQLELIVSKLKYAIKEAESAWGDYIK